MATTTNPDFWDHLGFEPAPPEACGWLIEIASGNPEPDSYADTIAIVPCGKPIEPTERRALCRDHAYAMDLPLDEFERISEAHDGRAWS